MTIIMIVKTRGKGRQTYPAVEHRIGIRKSGGSGSDASNLVVGSDMIYQDLILDWREGAIVSASAEIAKAVHTQPEAESEWY